VTQTYFNHKTRFAIDKSGRGRFLANWWHIFIRDPRWVPPYYPLLRRELEPAKNAYLARMEPIYAHTEALPSKKISDPYQPNAWLKQGWSSAPIYENPVAASLVLKDPRRGDAAAYLAMLRCVNDADSLKRFFDKLSMEMKKIGVRRLLGPTHMSPYLGSGVLFNYWNNNPPLYTPYNPPYLPETIRSIMAPLNRAHLFHLPVPTEPIQDDASPARILPFDPARLNDRHHDLMATACEPWVNFPPPDTLEVAFIYRWISRWPLYGWMAWIDQKPVGFILLQPDFAPLLKKAGGGRSVLKRIWLNSRLHTPVQAGRILFAGVLPGMRRRGVGAQLLQKAYKEARNQKWTSLSIGPIPEDNPGESFLVKSGAERRQRYWLYHLEL
jgi:ribosomal protein S18 acetylase RimI-like enzyme